jgi:hypothetical protein
VNGAAEANRGTRVKRHLLNVLTALWLFLCLATLSLWVAGHIPLKHNSHRLDGSHHLAGRWSLQLNGPAVGNISIGFFHDFPTPNIGPQFGPGGQYTPALLDWYIALPPGFGYQFLGLGVDHANNFEGVSNHLVLRGRHIGLSIPYWAAWALWIPLVIPALRIRQQQIRRYRIGKTLCPECGYDLRATPNRCPECGKTVLRAV